jgi:hypothetical protein
VFVCDKCGECILFLKEEREARNSAKEYVNVQNEMCLCFILVKIEVALMFILSNV